MKILIASDGHGEQTHAGAFANSFEELGHDVSKFTWKEYFKHYPYADCYPTDNNKLKSIYYRFQNKFTLGPALCKLNSDIVKKCKEVQPDLVFIYRGTHVFPSTIKKLKQTGAKVFGYNNDDPFSTKYLPYMWRHFKRCIPLYDHIFYYRYKNFDDYDELGCKNISMLRSYYIKANNFCIPNLKKNKFFCDIIFIGHFENDGRDDAIKMLIENKPLYNNDYNLALNSAKIAEAGYNKVHNTGHEVTDRAKQVIEIFTNDS